MGFPQLRTAKPFKFREPTAYVLTADAGTYTLTGSTAGVLATRKLTPVEAGTYAISGTDAILAKGAVTMAADAGSYALTGSDVDLSADVLEIPLSVTDIRRRNYPRAFHPSLQKPMRFAVPIVNYTLAADAGTYAVTGSTAGLLAAYKVAADGSSYTVNGTDASLFVGSQPQNFLSTTEIRRKNYPRAFHPSLRKPIRVAIVAAQDYIIAANPGTYTIGGEAAALNAGTPQVIQRIRRNKVTWPRQFAPTVFGQLRSEKLRRRQPFGLQPTQAFVIIAAAGTYNITAGNTAIVSSRKLTASGTSYAVTGTDAILTKGLLPANSGSYSITGSSVTLKHDHKLAIGTNTYAITGSAASLNRGFTLVAASGTYTYTGFETADFTPARTLTAESGDYAISGAAITIITDATIPIGTVIDEPVSITRICTGNVKVKTSISSRVNI